MRKITTALAGLLSLLALAPALAQVPNFPQTLPPNTVVGRLGGGVGPSQAIPFAILSGQLGTSGIPAESIEDHRGGCGSADNTAALIAAANAVTGPVRVTFPKNCTYIFRQQNVISFTKPVFLQCTGTTILQYNPTGPGKFLNWSNGSVLYASGMAGLDGCIITSAETTFTKQMVSFTDVSGFRFTNSSIGWPYGGVTGAGSGTGSTCLYTGGREFGNFSNLFLQCDKPIQIGLNPHTYLTQDHFHYRDLFLFPGPSYAAITVDPGVVFTNTLFDGYQSWVGGTDGFSYVDTAATHFISSVAAAGSGYSAGVIVTLTGGTCSTPIQIQPLTVNGSGGILTASITNPGVCSVVPSNPVSASSGGATFNLTLVAGYRLSFSNVRSEQGASPTAYTFNIQPKAQLQGLTISNSAMDQDRCGVFLKNALFATIQQSTFIPIGCNTAVNATAANGNDMVEYIDDFWYIGATHTVTNMVGVRYLASPTGTSATVPPSALYSSTISGTTFRDIAIAGSAVFSGSSSGITTVRAAAAASGTLTLPAATDTLVAKATPDTLTNKSISGSTNTLTNIANASLTNSAITINGTPISLGGSATVAAAASSVTVGTTTVTGGTNTALLFNNGGTLGNVVALPAANFPALTGDVTTIAGSLATTLNTAQPSVHTWALAQTFTAAPVFTDQSGTRSALGLGSLATLSAAPAGTLTGATLAAGVTASSLTSLGTITSLTAATINAFTMGGAISGGGFQINNVVIGTSTPLAGTFTTLTANTSISSPLHIASGALKFQSNGSTFAGSINTGQQWTIGSDNTAPSGPLLTVNKATSAVNQATSNGSVTTSVSAHLVGTDGAANNVVLDAYGNGGAPGFITRRAQGTQAAPTAVLSGDSLFAFVTQGYFGSGAYAAANWSGFGGLFVSVATENWDATHQGQAWDFYTTATGGTSLGARVRIGSGLMVGTTTDPGAGMIYTNAATFMLRTKTSLSNGAAAAAGTLTNAPAVGNPTKWLPYDDNGTTRYIPAW